MDGIRSSMSYVGAKNIQEYQSKCEFVTITSNGLSEATTDRTSLPRLPYLPIYA